METTLKNPFTECKVVGTVERDAYCRSEHPRGHPAFAMSRGELMEFNRCPHRWLMGYKSEETKATEWGTLLDCLALTPERFDDEFAVTPETYPATPKRKDDPIEQKPWNKNATYCKEWEDGQDGKIVVKSELMTAAQEAVKVLTADLDIFEILRQSEKQVMVVGEYKDQETGLSIPVKGLLDLLPDLNRRFGKSIADLKSCINGSPYPWTRTVFERGYHVQGAFYLDLYVAATGEDRIDFLHVLQESFAPWETGKRILSQEFIELGRLTYLTALKRYCQCLLSKKWPGYDSEGRMVLNGWNLTQPEAWMVGREL